MIRALSARWFDVILIGVALSALSLLIAPALAGYLIVDRVSATLQRLSLLHNVQWTVASTDQGWFETRLHTELRITGYEPVATRLSLVHGPVYLGMLQQQRSPFLLAYLRARPVAANAPEFQGVMQFNGDWSARLPTQDLSFRPLDGNPQKHLVLQSWRADIDYTADLRALALRAAAESVALGESGATAALVDLAMLGEYRLDASGWLFGDTSLRVADFSHASVQGRISGLELAASSTENGTTATASVTLRAEACEFLERDFGATELNATARNVSLMALRSWFHRSDSFSLRALHSLGADVDVRLAQFAIRDTEGASLMQADGTAKIAPPNDALGSSLSLDLSASRDFAEFVVWHGVQRTLGRSALFGKLNELQEDERAEVARASAAKQLSVLAARGYLSWNRGWYHTRLTYATDQWALNGRAVNVR